MNTILFAVACVICGVMLAVRPRSGATLTMAALVALWGGLIACGSIHALVGALLFLAYPALGLLLLVATIADFFTKKA